jgi:hypothetical protein
VRNFTFEKYSRDAIKLFFRRMFYYANDAISFSIIAEDKRSLLRERYVQLTLYGSDEINRTGNS